jgi:hypothetical protein
VGILRILDECKLESDNTDDKTFDITREYNVGEALQLDDGEYVLI